MKIFIFPQNFIECGTKIMLKQKHSKTKNFNFFLETSLNMTL